MTSTAEAGRGRRAVAHYCAKHAGLAKFADGTRAAFDANYRTPTDTIDNINRDAVGAMASVVASAVGAYAQSIEGPNGVPPRDQRRR